LREEQSEHATNFRETTFGRDTPRVRALHRIRLQLCGPDKRMGKYIEQQAPFSTSCQPEKARCGERPWLAEIEKLVVASDTETGETDVF
jgi:hypothetical protein